VSRRLDKIAEDNSYALPIIDGNSPYTQHPLAESKVEPILRRINFSGHYLGKDLANMKLQLSAEGNFVSLSKGESMIYHLQSVNNLNSLGFPGSWMLYYSDTHENGFFIQKVEPIKIIASCLVCPYGMIDELVEKGANMPDAEVKIISAVQKKHQPLFCPNSECRLYFSHNEHGAVYRDRHFSIHQELNDPGQHKLVLEMVPRGHPGMRIAKFIGPLRNPFYTNDRF
jgi:hypothetical protein